jgi:cobalt-precorrin 5A hydrolase
MVRIAIIAITRNGARLGTRLRDGLGNADLHVLKKYAGQAGKGAVTFDGELGGLLARLWPEYGGFVCIMATGIVVRLVASLLESKERDPAVVVVDDAGRFAISLLSGHLGGGNLLAERTASVIGARAVITTATDSNELPSFDMIAQAEGWEIDDISRVKSLNACLLDNEEVAIVDPTDRLRFHLQGKATISVHDALIGALRSSAKGVVLVSSRLVPPQFQNDRMLVLRPKSLYLGIGCNSGTTADEIGEVVASLLKRQFLSIKSVAGIGTAEAKREEAGLIEFAGQNQIPLRFYSSEELNEVNVPSPVSQHAMQAIGAQGVAEPAALLASGGGELIQPKFKSGNVTVAIAERT